MPPSVITPFGAFHTAVSVLAIGFGLWALARDGKIDPANSVGKLYLGAMLIGCLTAFGIYHHGGFGPGHVLSMITVAIVLAGIFATRVHWLGRAAPFVQTISLSTSFLLLMVFATTETLTRLPVAHPYAASQNAPELRPVHLTLLVLFVVGAAYQVFKIHATRTSSA
ncbi:MAG: hypothetical protein HYX69_15115 [Planctomycetia bacterium]|nr:hypothetical protein [Planctomycetia bacterium]